MNSNQYIEEFKNKIQPFLKIWKTIDIRIISVRKFGKWVNLLTKMELRSETLDEIKLLRSLPSIEYFKAIHVLQPINQLDDLLIKLQSGILPLNDGLKIIYGKKEGSDIKECVNFVFYSEYVSNKKVFKLYDSFDSFYNILENVWKELDECLRSFETPYKDLYDFVEDFLCFDATNRNSYLFIVASTNIGFTKDCKFKKRNLIICAEALGYKEVNNSSITLIQRLLDGSSVRKIHKLKKIEWQKVGKQLILKKKFPLEKRCLFVNVFLLYDGVVTSELHLPNPFLPMENVRVITHEFFDKNFSIFQRYLKGEGNNRNLNFVMAVTWLLHLCGLSVACYEKSGIQDEIDIIAFSNQSNKIFAVECTTSDPEINNKLSRLSLRYKRLQKKLRNYQIHPLLFTCLEDNELTKTSLDKAAKEQIGILTKEKIFRLHEIAHKPGSFDKALEYIIILITKKNSFSR